jgi:hypothetical protein
MVSCLSKAFTSIHFAHPSHPSWGRRKEKTPDIPGKEVPVELRKDQRRGETTDISESRSDRRELPAITQIGEKG